MTATTTGEIGADPTPPVAWWRREGGAFLELLAVTALAIARPTLGTLANNGTIFVENRTTPVQLIGLVVVLVLGPPFVLWLVEYLVGLASSTARRVAHVVFVAGVAGIFAIEVLKNQTDFSSALMVAIAIVGAAAGAFLLWRYRSIGMFLRYLAIAPVLFSFLFLTSGQVSAAVFESDPEVEAVPVREPHRVMMVVFDELPTMSLLDGQGGIDAGLFPNLAALVDQSTWYRNATTVAPFTGKAVPAILTGRYQAAKGDVQTAATAPENLFTLLGSEYEMNAEESGSQLCPERLCVPADQGEEGFGNLLSVARRIWWENATPSRAVTNPFVDDADMVGDPHGLETSEDFLAKVRPSGRAPRLDLLHALFPHQGWHYLPSGADYRQNASSPGIWWDFTWGSQWSADLAKQRHLLQVAAADRLLGQIVSKLKAMGEYDDTMLVVVADHGIAFGPRVGLRGLSKDNFPQIAWVPMIVKAPGQKEGAVDDRPAKTIDLLPTIAENVGVEIPWKVDGRSLNGAPREPGPIRMLEWNRNYMKAGKDGFTSVPGKAGFELVKVAKATNAPGTGIERLYKVGPYGGLLGRRIDEGAAPETEGTVRFDDPGRFDDVEPGARDAPWVYVAGSLRGVGEAQPLAITVNGVIAGFSGSYTNPLDESDVVFWTVADPNRFRRGDNDVRVWKIEGDPAAPRFTPLRTTG